MSEQELWNELGNLYFLSGSYNQATNAYQRSIQLDTDFGRPYSNLALTYVQQGKYEQAIELYRRSIELLTENREKAVSWNRLGTVYRHLKDYSRAVIAFQEADELDPESAIEFPATLEVRQASSPAPCSILDEPVVNETVLNEPVVELQPVQTEPEWWDVDQEHTEPAPLVEETVAATSGDPIESWTSSDPSAFQQDVSQMPETGSLTSWGDREATEEFEFLSPGDPGLDLPDLDEDFSTWLPVPEEEPFDADLLQIPPFLEEIQVEPPDPEPELNRAPQYHVVQSVDYGSLSTTQISAPALLDYGERSNFVPDHQSGSQQAREAEQVEVAVEERPAPYLAHAVEPAPRLVEPSPAPIQMLPPPEPAPLPEPLALERDAEEMREIELGIEKFRRVVQLNPRNAHAWDALGTLFKSAGLYKDAILSYQQAISNDSTKSLYYHHLGLVYACEGRDEDAITAFQQVIEIDPEYSLAHATLGGYYRKMGLEELAQKHIGKAMKNIFDSENEYNKACLQAICGNADQAIDLLRVALKNKQTYVDWILRDPDLDFIRTDPRFKQLISDYTR